MMVKVFDDTIIEYDQTTKTINIKIPQGKTIPKEAIDFIKSLG